MEKSSHEELTVLERQKLRKSMGDLKAGASDIFFCVSQLKLVEAYNDKRSRELEFKEKELQSLSSEIDKKVKDFEKEKSEAGNFKKMVEECTKELRSKKNELTAKLDHSTKIQREIELKKKQLGHFTAKLQKLCSEAGKVQDQKKVMEEETDRKKKELSLILSRIEESTNHFVTVDEQLNSARRLLEIQSLELQSLNNQLTVCDKEIDSKSKELGEIQKLTEQQTSELGVMKNQCDSVELLIQELSEELVATEMRHKETICRSSSEMEERAKEIKAAETEASDLKIKSERFRQEFESKEKELDLLKNQVESEEKKLLQLKGEMEEEIDRKKKELSLILDQTKESSQQLAAMDKQLESQGRLVEKLSVELVSKEKELECVGESSKGLKKKRFQALGELKEKQPKKAKVAGPSDAVVDPAQARFDQRAAAACLLAKSTPAVRLPPPATLLEDEAYGDAALNLFKFKESFNRMVALYEARSRSDKTALESLNKVVADQTKLLQDSQERHAIELAQANERAAKFKNEAAIHKKNAIRTADSNLKIVEKCKSLETEVGSLEEQLSAKDNFLEARVKKARSELNEKYGLLFDKVRIDLENLKGVQTRAAHLAQAKGNIELIEDILGKNPPDLNAELAELRDYVAGDGEAGKEASSLLTRAIDQLVTFQVS